jgi:lysyl-tRNA synthetase class 2
MIFMDLKSDNQKLQIICLSQNFSSEQTFNQISEIIKRGDIIGVVGTFGKSKTGEFSLMAKEVVLLAPCLHVLPDAKKGQTEVLTC